MVEIVWRQRAADTLLHWLCHAVSPLTAPRDVARLPEADWRKVMSLADWHMLLPELHLAALRHGAALGAPVEVVETLEAIHFLNAERNGRLRTQMRHLSRAFSAAGIRHVWLKGAVWLLQDDFASSGRMMNDLDLWFPDSEGHGDALRLLDDLGFHQPEGHVDADWHMSHHFAPRHSDDWPARVEPHRHVIDPRFAQLLPDDAVLRDVTWMAWEGASIGIPSIEHRLLHAVIQATVMAVPPFGTGHTPLMKALDVIRLCAEQGRPALPPAIVASLSGPDWSSWSRPFLTITDNLFGLANPVGVDDRVYRRLCTITRRPRLSVAVEIWARIVDGRLFRRLARPANLPRTIRHYIRALRVGRNIYWR